MLYMSNPRVSICFMQVGPLAAVYGELTQNTDEQHQACVSVTEGEHDVFHRAQ